MSKSTVQMWHIAAATVIVVLSAVNFDFLLNFLVLTHGFLYLFVSLQSKRKEDVDDSVVDKGRTTSIDSVAPISATDPAAPVDNSATNATIEKSTKDAPSVPGPSRRKSVMKKVDNVDIWGLPSVKVKDHKGNIIAINSATPVPFETDYFTGKIVLMVRTDGELEKYNRYRDHFKGKQRKFEIQVQGKFKHVPEGMVMMGGELPEKLTLGFMTKTLLKLILNFCSRLVLNMSFSFGQDATPDDKYECPYISFPLYRGMDRVVVTDTLHGDDVVLPELGRELPETDSQRSLRRGYKTPDITYNTHSIYSFSFHSMYMDLSNWSLCNVAGYKNVGLDTFMDKSPLRIIVYELKEDPVHPTKHFVCNKKYVSYLEWSHLSIVPEMSDSHEVLVEMDEDEELIELNEDELSPASPTNELAVEDAEEPISMDDVEDNRMVVLDNTNISLTTLPLPWEDNSNCSNEENERNNASTMMSHFGIGNYDGQAIRVKAPMTDEVRFIKVAGTRAPELSGGAASIATSPITNGDHVQVVHVASNSYLGAYGGFMLGWSATPLNDSKGHFVVNFVEKEATQRSGAGGRRARGTHLSAGIPFSLRSARWRQFQVGFKDLASYPISSNKLSLTNPKKDKMLVADSLVLYDSTKHDFNAIRASTSYKGRKLRGEQQLSQGVQAYTPLYMVVIDHRRIGGVGLNEPEAVTSSESNETTTVTVSTDPVVIASSNTIEMSLNGWIEVYHRTLHKYQILYMVAVTLTSSKSTDSEEGKEVDSNGAASTDRCTKWTMLKAGVELDDLLTALEGVETEQMRFLHMMGTPVNHKKSYGSGVELVMKQHETTLSQVYRLLESRSRKLMSGDSIIKFLPEAESIIRNFAFALPNILDCWFLSNDVISPFIERVLREPVSNYSLPDKYDGSNLLIAMVARALWEEHWSEEVAVFHESKLSFYLLELSNNPKRQQMDACLELPYIDLIGITQFSNEQSSLSPIPGVPVVRFETIGKMYYVAFKSNEEKDCVVMALLTHISAASTDAAPTANASVSSFVVQTSQWLPASRRILNSRFFSFDTGSQNPNSTEASILQLPYWELSAHLLKSINEVHLAIRRAKAAQIAQVSLHALESGSAEASLQALDNATDCEWNKGEARPLLNTFLKDVCCLKNVNLADIDYRSEVAYCFFVNVYHSLLLHSRLLLGLPCDENQAPDKAQEIWTSYFSDNSYQIGNDVFSLLELEYCVLKGSLSRPNVTAMKRKKTLLSTIPSLTDDHYAYALAVSDQRVHFVLNYGAVSCPPMIYLITPSNINGVLNRATREFLESVVDIDIEKRIVTLPAICSYFRGDFGEDDPFIMKHCLKFMDLDSDTNIAEVLTSPDQFIIKFDKFHYIPRKNVDMRSDV